MAGQHHGRTRVRGNSGQNNPEAQALRAGAVSVARVLLAEYGSVQIFMDIAKVVPAGLAPVVPGSGENGFPPISAATGKNPVGSIPTNLFE